MKTENNEEVQVVVQSDTKKKWTFGRILKTAVVGGLAIYGAVSLAKTETGRKVTKKVGSTVKGLFNRRPEKKEDLVVITTREFVEPVRNNYDNSYRKGDFRNANKIKNN